MKNLVLYIIQLFFFLNLISCSGYRVVKNENPLRSYGISSVSVPIFLNKSIMPGVAGVITAEIINELNRYYGLKVYNGENPKGHSVLLGIISSPVKRKDAKSNDSASYIPDNSDLKGSIGNRSQFYMSQSTKYKLSLRLILIKNPTYEEKKLAQSDLGKLMETNSKVIFNEVISLNSSYSSSLNSNFDSDDGGVVNYSQTRGVYRESIKNIARSAALAFRGVVLNVF